MEECKQLEYLSRDGNIMVILTFDVLEVENYISFVGDDSCGAISSFIGTTRNNFQGKQVKYLEYEAYSEMAVATIIDICNKIKVSWNVSKIIVGHKLGSCPVGEKSVIIAISSPHRKDSLDAVQYCIDELKNLVPIWKKEIYENDESIWKSNK